MKKIYFIASSVAIALFTACQDYNTTNFPELIGAGPTNVVSYTYSLTDADYTSIATAVKKPVNDSITTYKALLKTANRTDSIVLNASINRLTTKLTTDSVYIKANYVGNNKILNSNLKGKDYLPFLFNQKYIYADKGSVIKVTYNNVDNGDTLSIPATSRFILTDVDYIQMGTGTNQPGQYKEMSSTMSSVITYLNSYLKIKCPYAVAGDVKVVSYLFYDSNKIAKKQYRILSFDGQNWGSIVEQYIYNGKEWVYDPTITLPLVRVSGNNPYIMKFIDYIRTNTPEKFFQKGTYINEEHYYGFSAYYAEIIYTNDRTTYGDAAIKALTTDADKYVLFKKRVAEAMPLFTQLNFPDLKTDVSGIQQYVVFTIISYYSSSKSGLYTIKMKCIKSGTGTTPAEYEVVNITETL